MWHVSRYECFHLYNNQIMRRYTHISCTNLTKTSESDPWENFDYKLDCDQRTLYQFIKIVLSNLIFIMVKYSILVVVLLVTILYLGKRTVEAQKFPEILESCKTSEKATDNDFLNLKMNVKPKTKPMKCLGTCIYEKLGKINKNKINPDGVLAYIKTLPIYNDKLQQSVKEMIECKSIEDADRCEYRSKLMDCFSDAATKRGIKPGSLYPQ